MKQINNGIPFVGRTSRNNGITGFVEVVKDVNLMPENTISVSCGGSVLESFFQPETNTSTGTTVRPARFSTALSEASGHTSTADRQWRRVQALSRRSRAIIALEQLTLLGQAGWDVSKAASIAQEALLDDDTHLAAVSFLSVLGTPVAQQTLYYEARELDLPATQRSQARDGFATSVRRNGILLESRHLL